MVNYPTKLELLDSAYVLMVFQYEVFNECSRVGAAPHQLQYSEEWALYLSRVAQ